MENKPIALQCRGKEGKLAKDVGVVITKSDSYQDTCVEILCPHYIKHPRKSESAHISKAGCCEVSKLRKCLYDSLTL